MIEFNEEFSRYNELMFEKFGTPIPTMQIDLSISNEELFAIVEQSLKEGRNLLPEYFGYGNDPSDTIY